MRVGRTVVIPKERREARNECLRSVWFLWVGIALLALLGLCYFEYNWRAKNEAYTFASSEVLSLGHDTTAAASGLLGKLVHYTSSEVQAPTLVDKDFQISVDGGVKLERVTEYCQWVESASESEDSDGNTIRTYYYTKSWVRQPIVSIAYDQPFRHHNPLRDPVPAFSTLANEIQAGPFSLKPEMYKNIRGSRNVRFDLKELGPFFQSEAALIHGFKPIGNGYFYSSYDEGTAALFLRMAGSFMEGSFDVQLGDLFNSCTPGDIRVHFEAVAPSEISVIGKLTSPTSIGPYQGERGYSVALTMPGIWNDPNAMLQDDLDADFYGLVISRIAFSIVITIFATMGLELPLTGPLDFIFFSLSSWCLVWFGVHGPLSVVRTMMSHPITAAIVVSLLIVGGRSYLSHEPRATINFPNKSD